MARLTVEDCLGHVDNRFDLILKASKRARLIERGAEPLVEWNNDKPTVLALREIASGLLDQAVSQNESENESEMILEADVAEDIEAPTEQEEGTTLETTEAESEETESTEEVTEAEQEEQQAEVSDESEVK